MTKAFPPLLVAGYGAAIAYIALTVHPVAAFVGAVVPLMLGVAAILWARRIMASDPVESLRWFEIAQLLPYSMAAAASAVLIWLAVVFAPPDRATPPEGEQAPPPTTFEKYFPEILKAIAGAVSAFITAAFIKASEEPDSWVADRVKSGFQKTFAFKPGSEGDNAVRGTALGWDKSGRTKRATAIAAALRDPTQNP